MRIQFGSHKGRKLVVGNNKKMKPTQSITKDKIFNTISINEGDVFVDLFAGTGAVGFEAASLGASKVIWSDIDSSNVKAISENIEKLGLDENFKAYKSDFRLALKKLDFKADYIFIDPPFVAVKYYDEVIELVEKYDILSEKGILIIEKPRKVELKAEQSYKIKVRKNIGDKEVLILEK